MGQLGIMCGPLMGGFLLDLFDFGISFYASSSMALLALFIALVLYKRTPHASEEKTRSTVQISWGWLKQRIIIAALLIPLFLGFGVSNLQTYIPLYSSDNAISDSQIGIIIAIYYASSAVLRVPFGRLTDRLGPRPIMAIGFFIFAIGMASFSMVDSFPLVSLVGAFFGLGFGVAFPAGLVIMANLAQPSMRGMAMAMYTSTFQIGVALGSSTMGFLADATSFERMFQVSGILMLAGVSAFYLLTRNRRKDDFVSNDV
jgi:predicted MFS family arabinose efflux permease